MNYTEAQVKIQNSSTNKQKAVPMCGDQENHSLEGSPSLVRHSFEVHHLENDTSDESPVTHNYTKLK